ncbi:hypothetical protein L3X38_000889 [Prunus dulcis]|uniref:Non-haem dioxygenase N-terminal domain-containing protein n=1 Tax=Prunus dulcis TaxID=3755 RepID=A0AAD4WTH2_PRUDU|nr:hypothetical protein L3X38_000889 [Prunus dulcis]
MSEGVKGLVDAGITEVPRIFHQPPDEHFIDNTSDSEATQTQFSIPLIDLEGLALDSPTKRKEIVAKVGEASETWGFFQIANHGIPIGVLEEIKDGVRGFFEQDTEVKKELYTRDYFRPVIYNSNFDLYKAPATNWRDTFICYITWLLTQRSQKTCLKYAGSELGDNGVSMDVFDATIISSNFWPQIQVMNCCQCWTSKNLAAAIGVPTDILNRRINFWISKGILAESLGADSEDHVFVRILWFVCIFLEKMSNVQRRKRKMRRMNDHLYSVTLYLLT